MPFDAPTPDQIAQETELMKRINAAGYAGIPTGGSSVPQQQGPGTPNMPFLPPQQNPNSPALPPAQQMPFQPQMPPPSPADQQTQTLQRLGQGAEATGFKSQKAPSAIPLHFVLGNDSDEMNVGVTPVASGNKYRALEGELGLPVGPGELSLQGGAGRVMGHYKSPYDYDVKAKYEAHFAGGGFVDGQSLVEPIGPNTQQQIDGMMSHGGLAAFAQGGSVSGLSQLRSEFQRRGLDFDKFLYGDSKD